jgi:hypothetical protein
MKICRIKVIAPLSIGLALSACATDYTSQLAEPNFGRQVLNSKDSLDPSQLTNGLYLSRPAAAFCLSTYGCSQQPPLWASGFAP